jgi:hypothetical protein
MHCFIVYGEVFWSAEEPGIGESLDHKAMERGGVVWDELEELSITLWSYDSPILGSSVLQNTSPYTIKQCIRLHPVDYYVSASHISQNKLV